MMNSTYLTIGLIVLFLSFCVLVFLMIASIKSMRSNEDDDEEKILD
jgi:hypothetical protein